LFKSHLRGHYSTAFIQSTLTCRLQRTHSSFAPIKLRFDRQTLAPRLHEPWYSQTQFYCVELQQTATSSLVLVNLMLLSVSITLSLFTDWAINKLLC